MEGASSIISCSLNSLVVWHRSHEHIVCRGMWRRIYSEPLVECLRAGGDDENKRLIALWSTIKGSAFPIHVSAIVLAWPLQHGKNEDTLQGVFQSIKTSPRTRSGKDLVIITSTATPTNPSHSRVIGRIHSLRIRTDPPQCSHSTISIS